MVESCPHGERIAGMQERLKYGDTILEKLSEQIETIKHNVSKLLQHIEGESGILEKQKIHERVITEIVNLKTVDKVERHHVWYIIGAAIAGFFGLATLTSILYMGTLINRFTNLIH